MRAAREELGPASEALVLREDRDARWYGSLDAEVLNASALGPNRAAVDASIAERHPRTLVDFVDTRPLERIVDAYRQGAIGIGSVTRCGSFRPVMPVGHRDGRAVVALGRDSRDRPLARVGVAEKISDAVLSLLSDSHSGIEVDVCNGWHEVTERLLPFGAACVTTVELAALAVCLGKDTILLSYELTPEGEADFDALDRVATAVGVELTRLAESGARLLIDARAVSLDSSA